MSDQAGIKPLLAENLFSVNGLTAIITGGGSGLGAYMTRALAVNGASQIFILGRREEALQKTKSSLPDQYAKVVVPVVADVTSKESLSNALAVITTNHKVTELDVLVCNSGILGPGVNTTAPTIEEISASMLRPSEGEITETFRVNLTGVHLTIGTFLPLLDAANKARPEPNATNFKPRPQIITTSSIGAFNRRPMANISYGPSKAAVAHVTKQLATMLVPYDIRANTIAPGLYLTDMTTAQFAKQGASDNHNVEGAISKEQIPATRGGDEQDMAGVILWLCSRAGAYINGCVVVTDGGRLSVVPASY